MRCNEGRRTDLFASTGRCRSALSAIVRRGGRKWPISIYRGRKPSRSLHLRRSSEHLHRRDTRPCTGTPCHQGTLLGSWFRRWADLGDSRRQRSGHHRQRRAQHLKLQHRQVGSCRDPGDYHCGHKPAQPKRTAARHDRAKRSSAASDSKIHSTGHGFGSFACWTRDRLKNLSRDHQYIHHGVSLLVEERERCAVLSPSRDVAATATTPRAVSCMVET